MESIVSQSQPEQGSSFNYLTFDPSNLKPIIGKKTERGRKTRRPLPKDPRCEICLDYPTGNEGSEQLLCCSICHAYLHPSCYHLKLGPVEMENFTCERCRNAILYHNPIESYKCFICMQSNGVLKMNKYTGEFYHCLCLSFISELYENKANEKSITKGNIRKWRYKNSCRYCGEKLDREKAVIKCNNTKCKGYFHIPCAIEKGMIFSLNYLYSYFSLEYRKEEYTCPFFCSCHNKRLSAAYKRYLFDDKKEENSLEPIEEQVNENMSFTSLEDSNTNSARTYENTDRMYDPYSINNFVNNYEENLPNCSSAMDLNFNEIEMEFQKEHPTLLQNREYENNINSSPKNKIPLEFVYGKLYD
ncbi:MAG: hypothetical protein MJ252_22345 [archaeon]|nr:hypothetical protein [archaeon]